MTPRTFTNEMTKFENRFGKIRDEEKVLGTAMLENIIIDKVSTVPTARSRKHDTSAPMEL